MEKGKELMRRWKGRVCYREESRAHSGSLTLVHYLLFPEGGAVMSGPAVPRQVVAVLTRVTDGELS